MRRWQVAVATENPKILYLVVRLLKRLKTSFVMCAPEDFRAYSTKVVVTTQEEASRIATQNQLIINEDFDTELFSIALQSRLHDIEDPRFAFIGIDPGMNHGIALVVQGWSVFQARHSSPYETARAVSRLINHTKYLFPGCEVAVRLGSGSRLFSLLLLRELGQLPDSIGIEMVNEEHTTISGGPKADISSAIIIAGRSGRPVSESDTSFEAKAGDIRALKSLVSRMTHGQRKITSDDARAVIEGGQSLQSLIETISTP